MTPESSRSLGHGVRVTPGGGGELLVLSEIIDFGWRPRASGRPGSAVMIDGEGFEVVDRRPWGSGARWTLEPWSGEDVMRGVQPLDETAVEALAKDASAQAKATRIRPIMCLLAPILGLADASWQRRWRDEWNYPASTATWISAILEMFLGGACLIEFIAAMGAGASIFPWIPRPLVRVGVYFFGEGIVRLILVFADSEPVGSLLGAAVSVFERKRKPGRAPVAAQKVKRFDDAPGFLKTVLLNIVCTMAPARFQERWAWWVGMRAMWFTVAGSLVELLGGVVSLRAGADGLSVLLNLYFVAEAASRLAFVFLKRQPMGSVFGLVLTPILDRVLPD